MFAKVKKDDDEDDNDLKDYRKYAINRDLIEQRLKGNHNAAPGLRNLNDLKDNDTGCFHPSDEEEVAGTGGLNNLGRPVDPTKEALL